ncbi:cyclase family protein [Candidatus Magnetobacterium bavaricum]|uniref:Cyclase family protein n=1 Tax=Candidatus Magnetobacterium bavaricum TaxID=29290 RepID=A0A0F3GJU1_9BACT|nr:cyclase family protein [Candidatus Magnetobacterium bavaricum]
MKSRFLSYPLSSNIPVYGIWPQKPHISPVRSLIAGDSCNVYNINIENHWGTHVDCPAHFFNDGKKVVDYEADFWLFEHPQVITVKAKEGQLIDEKDMFGDINEDTDLLIIYSGWGKQRNTVEYAQRNPGLRPEFGFFLRNGYNNIRAVGFDWISVSSYMYREIGRDAHRAFLNPAPKGSPVVIIEDMLLYDDMTGLKEVFVMPLRIEEVDSAPCTVLGVWND